MKKIIIWHNLNKDIYYYKIVKCCYRNYYVGYHNQYNHEIILIIDIYKDFFKFKKMPFRKRVIKNLISFLHKLEQKL